MKKRINTARERNKRVQQSIRNCGIMIAETDSGIKICIEDKRGNGVVQDLGVDKTIHVAATMMIAVRHAAERAGRSWNAIGDEFFAALLKAQQPSKANPL